MAKKKKASKKQKFISSPIGRKLGNQLVEIDQLIDAERYNDALFILEDLSTQHQKRIEVIERLCDVYYLIGDYNQSLVHAEKLISVAPSVPNFWIKLATSAMYNDRQLQALRAAQRFLKRWPDHPAAPDAEKIVDLIENIFLPDVVENFGLPLETVLQITEMHERSRSYLERGQYAKAKKELEKLIKSHPEFTAAQNNLAQVYWQLGDIPAAIETEEHVLSFEPQNLHALSNLVRLSLLAGDEQAARDYANKMQSSIDEAYDPLYKKIEALAFLGDDEIIISLENEVMKEPDHNSFAKAHMLHFVAISYARSGNEKKAKKLWEQALEIAPYLKMAQINLDDLTLPVEFRHGPSPFEPGYWIPEEIFKRFANNIHTKNEMRLQKAVDQFQNQFLGLDTILARMLERGGERGREIAVAIIRVCETPSLLEIYKKSALGQDGPDSYRFEALNYLKEQHVIEESYATVWMKGGWQEIQLMGYHISFEPDEILKGNILKLFEKAHTLLLDSKGEEAEILLKQAIKLEPDNPSLKNNLAMAYQVQGRYDEAIELTEEIFDEYPDYTFARLNLARLAMEDEDFERARKLIEPVTKKTELHISEFTNLARIEIDLALAKEEKTAAERWLEMWEAVYPEDDNLFAYKLRVHKDTALETMKKLMFDDVDDDLDISNLLKDL